MINKLICAVLCSAFFVTAAKATPIQWTAGSGGNGHFYEVISAPGIDFEVAESAALGLGAGWNLASITSVAEQAFIISLLPNSPADRDHYWLGGTDRVTEGVWEWLDGEVFTYTNWWSGEPNNSSAENFLAMDYRNGSWTWMWNDVNNNFPQLVKGYIVESVPEPTTLALLGLGLAGLGFRAKRKK